MRESLWQYHQYTPNDNIPDSESVKVKAKIKTRSPTESITKDVRGQKIQRIYNIYNILRSLQYFNISIEIFEHLLEDS